jgi:hypothetical protein
MVRYLLAFGMILSLAAPASALPQAERALDGPLPTQKTSALPVCLKVTVHKLYVSVENDRKTFSVNRDSCGLLEWHALLDLDGPPLRSGDKVAVRTYWGLYWSAQRNGELQANRPELQAWETFTIHKIDGPGGAEIGYGSRINLRGAHDKFVAVATTGRRTLTANASVWKQGEAITLEGLPRKMAVYPIRGTVLLPGPTAPGIGRIVTSWRNVRHGSTFGYGFRIEPRQAIKEWGSILHKGQSDKKRGPAIFFHPNSTRLHVRIGTDKSWNEGCDSKRALPLKKWSHVFVQFKPGLMEVYIDGKLNNRCAIGKRIMGNGGPLFSGSPWMPPARAMIRDLRLFPEWMNSQSVAILADRGR